ncbi:hypothetical protein [Variovorax sp. GB1P17]|uniref:hypothetical protein n=1 Tax=Variovorax sp. GB1P17 TaxID=3443740 RepID=UPI003F454AA9
MSGNDTLANFDGDDALRDPALRRALDHAPDSEATPDPRTREAIRKMAHNLATTPVSAAVSAANSASGAPWWRRLLGGGEPRSRMPWNAAFATVLVATFVTVLWHREPVPDAQLDGEARVAGAAAPAQAPAPIQSPAEITPQASQPATSVAPEPTPPSVAVQQAPASPAAVPHDSRAKESANASTADEVRRPAAAQPYARQAPRAPESDQKKSVEASAPVPAQAAPAPIAPSPPPAIAAEQSAAPARDEQHEKQLDGERRRAYSAAPPAASVAPPPTVDLERSPSSPPAPAAAPRPAMTRKEAQGNNTSLLAGQANADAQATGSLRQAPPLAAAKVAKPSGAASFAALDQWTSFDFARSGPGVRKARGDVEGLAALVNTVARSATSADQPLAAPVEARLALYRGDALVAVLEIAGDQVRWTPQPDGIATVGTPPAQALAALRALLMR